MTTQNYGDSYRIAGPIVTRLVDDETLKKMGAEKMGSNPPEQKDGSA